MSSPGEGFERIPISHITPLVSMMKDHSSASSEASDKHECSRQQLLEGYRLRSSQTVKSLGVSQGMVQRGTETCFLSSSCCYFYKPKNGWEKRILESLNSYPPLGRLRWMICFWFFGEQISFMEQSPVKWLTLIWLKHLGSCLCELLEMC